MSKRETRSSKRRASQHKQQCRERRTGRLEEVFARATAAHRAGDLASAQRLYSEIVSRDERHADAWHLLGFAEFHSKRFHEALQHIRRAISLRPDSGEYHHNLALVLLASGEPEDAARHAKLAITYGYHDAQSYLQVGLELVQQHQLAQTQLAQTQLAQTQLAQTQLAQTQLVSADVCFQLAIAIDGTSGDAHYLLGIVRESQGRFDEAIACYERAVAARPTFVEAMNNLGNLLRQRGRYQQATATLQRGLSLQPERTELHVNLGATYHAVGQLELAIKHFQTAHRNNDSSPEILVKLAAALTARDQLGEAKRCYTKLQRLQPNRRLWALCEATLCPTVFLDTNESDQVRGDIDRTLGRLGDGSLMLTEQELFTLAPPPPFSLQFFPGNLRSIKEQFAAIYRSTIDGIGEQLDRRVCSTPARSDGRIRVGFVITPGKEGVFLRSMQGVIERLDAERFAPSLVCWQPSLGILERAFQGLGNSFVVLPPAWKPLAEKLLTEAFDILYYFEIGTDSANYFLPFFRLAPIQCTSWGIQVTSGIPQVDHYLSSQLVEPTDAADHYSEHLVLAETLLCYRTRTPLPHAPKSREQFGFTPSQNLYVCAQQLGKFHTDFDPLIAAILRQDNRAVLAVTSDRSGVAARRLRERFAVTMPDVAARVVLLPHLERDEYRSLLLAADVLLDPPHFGGVNSTYDGLSYGKPIVTLPSGFHRGRYTLGCYRKMQLEDGVASGVDEYIALAGRIARESDFRDHLSRRISDASSSLFEDRTAVSEHERLFEELVANYLRD